MEIFTMNLIQELEKEQFEKLSATKTIPDFGPGDTVIVNVKVVEGDRSRVQAYEGVCIGRNGGGLNESFTVRKISYGEGCAPRQGASRQAVLPAQPARQIGPHRRKEDRPRTAGRRRCRRRRVISGPNRPTEKARAQPRAFLLRLHATASPRPQGR
jgi:ribosomal protein L19